MDEPTRQCQRGHSRRNDLIFKIGRRGRRAPEIAGCEELPQHSAEVNGAIRTDGARWGYRGIQRG
jgi:hypothetical protein